MVSYRIWSKIYLLGKRWLNQHFLRACGGCTRIAKEYAASRRKSGAGNALISVSLESDTARFFKISEFLLSFCYHSLPIPPNIEKRTFRKTSESPIKSILLKLLDNSNHTTRPNSPTTLTKTWNAVIPFFPFGHKKLRPRSANPLILLGFLTLSQL